MVDVLYCDYRDHCESQFVTNVTTVVTLVMAIVTIVTTVTICGEHLCPVGSIWPFFALIMIFDQGHHYLKCSKSRSQGGILT